MITDIWAWFGSGDVRGFLLFYSAVVGGLIAWSFLSPRGHSSAIKANGLHHLGLMISAAIWGLSSLSQWEFWGSRNQLANIANLIAVSGSTWLLIWFHGDSIKRIFRRLRRG